MRARDSESGMHRPGTHTHTHMHADVPLLHHERRVTLCAAGMLAKEPEARLTPEQLEHHPWVTDTPSPEEQPPALSPLAEVEPLMDDGDRPPPLRL